MCSLSGPVVIGDRVAESDAFKSDVFSDSRSLRKGFREIVGEFQLLVIGMLFNLNREEGTVTAVARDGALNVARVSTSIDVFQ